MDGGGRLDQPLTRSGQSAAKPAGAPVDEPDSARVRASRRRHRETTIWLVCRLSPAERTLGRENSRAYRCRRASALPDRSCRRRRARLWRRRRPARPRRLSIGSEGARDVAANSLGFRIAKISITGEKEVSREEVLTTAGVTGRASLLFLDADAARAQLMANPWIADAALLKLYPDRLQITITERLAFALWQKDGRLSVIAADGTVLEPFVEDRYLNLPLVVGAGRRARGQGFPRRRRPLSRHPFRCCGHRSWSRSGAGIFA